MHGVSYLALYEECIREQGSANLPLFQKLNDSLQNFRGSIVATFFDFSRSVTKLAKLYSTISFF